ncbi:carotenoid biosynthesis protein [Spirosoma sp. SC4-14]|uniref:carotenoid biosynthesis protein n=1 Tax=Spirosoma sp. SC4-14 TaxID=3128900 RepID=UPI0030D0EC9A
MPLNAPTADRYYSTIRTVLLLAYLGGIIGLQLPFSATYFKPLTPYILTLSLLILLLYHTDWQPAFGFYILFASLTSYAVEVLGVQTGTIFGWYTYGTGLGSKLWSVPPAIGINWLILSYCCGSVFDRLPISVPAKIGLASTTMVILDMCIEPVAEKLDFWTWQEHIAPLQNYVAWWLISAVLLGVWYRLPFRKENRLAKWLLALQFIFFLGQILFMFI